MCSSCLTRAMYFSELELATIYGSGQKTGKQNLQVFRPEPCISARSSLQEYTVRVKNPEHKIVKFLTRAVYFSELALAEIYGSGQKTGKQNLQIC